MSITNHITQLSTDKLPSFMRSTLSLMAILCVVFMLIWGTISIIRQVKIDLPDWMTMSIGTILGSYATNKVRDLSSINNNANTPTI